MNDGIRCNDPRSLRWLNGRCRGRDSHASPSPRIPIENSFQHQLFKWHILPTKQAS